MNTCSSPNWCAGVIIGGGEPGYRCTPTRHVGGKMFKGGSYGRVFATSDEAWDHMRQAGYSQEWFSRPNAFIDLRLSPATRRFLRGADKERFWELLTKLLGKDGHSEYFRAVKSRTCMDSTNARWVAAIYGPLGGSRREEARERRAA